MANSSAEAIQNSEEPRVKAVGSISLIRYCIIRFLSGSGSVYIPVLASAIFLSFIMDGDNGCEDKAFMMSYFYIGILHFSSQILGMLTEWTKEVFSSDGRVNKLEKIITILFYIFNQVIRIIQLFVPLELGIRVIMMVIQNEKWTYF